MKKRVIALLCFVLVATMSFAQANKKLQVTLANSDGKIVSKKTLLSQPYLVPPTGWKVKEFKISFLSGDNSKPSEMQYYGPYQIIGGKLGANEIKLLKQNDSCRVFVEDIQLTNGDSTIKATPLVLKCK